METTQMFNAEQGAGISAEELELLALLMADEEGPEPAGRTSPLMLTLAPRPDPSVRPLSFAQQRLWFFEQLTPGTPTFNIPLALRVTGPLDIEVLARSISEVVRRHEVLRTSFLTVQGEPVIQVTPSAPVEVPVVDLRALAAEPREAEVRRLAREEARRPFDLAVGPLWRVKLLWVEEAAYVLLLTVHHISADGWSMGILVQEITALYLAFAQGRPSPLPELPIQYVDFAYWQQQWLQGAVLDKQLAYWQQQLAHLPTLKLPLDGSRSGAQHFQGADHRVRCSPALSEAIRTLSQGENATTFMTLLAAFGCVLHFYAGQDDVVIGTDVANRRWAEAEGLIGFFVNQLVLRLDFSGNPTFRQLLARVGHVSRDAYEHQDLPFEQLVKALNLERTLTTAPLFQAKLFLQHVPAEQIEMGGLTLTNLGFESETARLDLVLGLWESDQGISGWFNYNTTLFEASTIARMVACFEETLTQVTAHPDIPLDALMQALATVEKTQKMVESQKRAETNLQKFKKVTRKTVELPERS